MRLFALTCGWLVSSIGNFLEGERGGIRVPVPCYLIDHPRGRLLFDSGMHSDVRVNPADRLGSAAPFYTAELAPGDEVGSRLRALGFDPLRVDYLVQSHLHFDHSGGNHEMPNARLVVQRAEWRAGLDPDMIESNHYDPRNYDLGHDLLEVDGEHDVFGDGRVVCVPTYGHTPGHQSLRVRLDSGEVILASDACYLRRTLDELHLPPVLHDREMMLASLRKLARLRDGGAKIYFGHDPEFWAALPQAPEAIT